ncbi:uncharacterized protein LJ206_007765 isoform 3-T3 [Theristicus caerulescens]
MPSPDPPGAEPQQTGGRSRRIPPPPAAARSGAERRGEAGAAAAQPGAEPGAEPGAAGGCGSGSTAADGSGQRLPPRLGKSFPDPNRVKTRTKKIHCINILPKKGRFALTPSTGSSFVAIYSMRQSNLEKIHLSSLTTFWCNFREVYCLFMWKRKWQLNKTCSFNQAAKQQYRARASSPCAVNPHQFN